MMVELIREISDRRSVGLKMYEPKYTLAGASYNVKTSSEGIGWKIRTGPTLPVNPKGRSF
jgi:hypothetical protein